MDAILEIITNIWEFAVAFAIGFLAGTIGGKRLWTWLQNLFGWKK